MYANESPGRITNVHIITSRYRKFAPKNSRFGFIATYGLDGPLEPVESIEHACAYSFIICAGRARPLFKARSDGFLAVLAKNTGRGLSSKSEGLKRGAKEHEPDLRAKDEYHDQSNGQHDQNK